LEVKDDSGRIITEEFSLKRKYEKMDIDFQLINTVQNTNIQVLTDRFLIEYYELYEYEKMNGSFKFGLDNNSVITNKFVAASDYIIIKWLDKEDMTNFGILDFKIVKTFYDRQSTSSDDVRFSNQANYYYTGLFTAGKDGTLQYKMYCGDISRLDILVTFSDTYIGGV